LTVFMNEDLSLHGFAHENMYTRRSSAISVHDTWRAEAQFFRILYSYSCTSAL